jgi:hypothetical protein
MRLSAWLWILAFLLTLITARWQRTTGPTYQLSGRAELGGAEIAYVLHRTHAGAGDHEVRIAGLPEDVAGTVEWKPRGSQADWTRVPMRREGDTLTAALPHQPPAGRLWYRVRLVRGPGSLLIPPERPAAIRFRGDVPAAVLVPHIVLMFLAMLLSARAGLEAFRRVPRLRALAWWTVACTLVGGIVLGVFVTNHAFGEWWTGWPVGDDLTDTKTLIAFAFWLAAALVAARPRLGRVAVVVAALVMLVIFVIPHSWAGGEPTHGQLDGAVAPAVASADTAPGAVSPDTTAP